MREATGHVWVALWDHALSGRTESILLLSFCSSSFTYGNLRQKGDTYIQVCESRLEFSPKT